MRLYYSNKMSEQHGTSEKDLKAKVTKKREELTEREE